MIRDLPRGTERCGGRKRSKPSTRRRGVRARAQPCFRCTQTHDPDVRSASHLYISHDSGAGLRTHRSRALGRRIRGGLSARDQRRTARGPGPSSLPCRGRPRGAGHRLADLSVLLLPTSTGSRRRGRTLAREVPGCASTSMKPARRTWWIAKLLSSASRSMATECRRSGAVAPVPAERVTELRAANAPPWRTMVYTRAMPRIT
jgi:hypothetical protein